MQAAQKALQAFEFSIDMMWVIARTATPSPTLDWRVHKDILEALPSGANCAGKAQSSANVAHHLVHLLVITRFDVPTTGDATCRSRAGSPPTCGQRHQPLCGRRCPPRTQGPARTAL